jgi:pimeloyl-ACP methyl ester carboxylesterase
VQVIAPQFLAIADFARHDLPAKHARWGAEAWLGGEPARAPFGLSSFDVFDALVARLADRKLYPNLERIVIVGHSGGAQVVQRYAVVGRADEMIAAAGLHAAADGTDVHATAAAAPGAAAGNTIRLRYVVANPSSYVYMDDTRPQSTERCSEYNHWRYGFVDPTLYARADRPDNYEKRYLARRVIYLNGGADNDPNHSALDKSCMAEAQGAHRLQRGAAYFAHVQKRAAQRNLTLHHVRIEVPGIAHDPRGMLNSKCGLAALFDTAGCEALPALAASAAEGQHAAKSAAHDSHRDGAPRDAKPARL